MKLKDIKVGAEYAIGAPTSDYPYRRTRGRIVKVGVYGEVSAGVCMYTSSARATYVEFEYTGGEDKDSGAAGAGYMLTVGSDGNRVPHSWGRRDTSKDRQVLRCLGTHILKPWAEYLDDIRRQVKERAEGRKESMKRLAEKKTRTDAIRNEFKVHGHTVSCNEHSAYVEMDFETAEEILGLLDTLSDIGLRPEQP